jgi:cysteinyl-tRNA synthetase
MVTKRARLFGLIDPSLTTGIGGAASSASGGGDDSEAIIDALAEFRERVRTAARSGDTKALFDACDWVRDEKMATLGVKLEDTEGAAATASWKRADPEALMEEIRRRSLAAAEAAERDAEAAAGKAAEADAKTALIAIAPERLFIDSPKYAGQFSEFDESGMPTLTSEGEAVSKKMGKKLAKARDNHIQLRTKNGFAPPPAPGASAAAPAAST